nr:capsid protein [Picobirnavirus sp.]AVD97003.1 capsid protein [Picobirnavirus sp.]
MSKKEFNAKGNGMIKRGRNPREFKARSRYNLDEVKSNDVNWYNKYAENYRTASQVPVWFEINGSPVPLYNCVPEYLVSSQTKERPLPGIMAVEYVPGPGIAQTNTDAINKAFSQIMAEIYSKTAADALKFQQADLAMLLTSLSTTVGLIAEAKRALETVDFWTTRSVNYPKALVTAMGFNWQDISRYRANYTTRLNNLIHQFNNMHLPDFLDIYHRFYSLGHNVYIDEDSQFAQIIFFKMKGFYTYDDQTFKCTWNEISGVYNMDVFLDLIERTLVAWETSSDLYNIKGCLIRAYSDSTVLSISDASVNDMLSPVLDRYMMLQLMNADIIDYTNIQPSSLEITQNVQKNVLIWQPTSIQYSTSTEVNGFKLGSSHYLRAYDETLSADDNVEMTRLCVTWQRNSIAGTNDQFKDSITSMNTEFVCGVNIYACNSSSTNDFATLLCSIKSNADLITVSNADKIAYIMALSPFRYIPRMWLYNGSDESFTTLGDTYNYTTIGAEDLFSLNTMCALSMWKPLGPKFN